MTAIANVSELVNRLSNGNNGNPEFCNFWKDTSAVSVLGAIPTSLWAQPGQPGPGAVPGAAAVPTAATAGAFRHLDSTGGRQRFLRSLSATAWGIGRLIFYDRLLHCGGLSGTITTAQTVGVDITRYTGQDSIGNIMFAEVYTTVGVTSVNLSCNYLDKDGVSRASGSVSIGGNSGRAAGSAIIIPYNTTTGANSVTRVVDATLSASTGTAGNWGITIGRPLVEIDIGAIDTGGVGTGSAELVKGDIEMLAGCCPNALFIPAVTALNYVRGHYQTLER